MDFLSRLSDLLGDALLPDEVRAPLLLANELLARGDYAGAEREARAALEHRKDLPRGYLLLGLARRGLGDVDGARAALREALRRAPGNPAAHLALAECELSLGDAARALREVKRAREAGAPADESALLAARAHLARGEVREAREALEVLAESERPVEALRLLGTIRLETGDASGARAAFEAALARGGPDPATLAGLARSLAALGQPAQALPHALRALSEAPADAAIPVLVGDLHAAQGNPAAALAAYERALELNARSAQALRGAASAARALGDLDRAHAFYEKALAQDPEDAPARAGLEAVELDLRLRAESAAREKVAAEEAELALRPDDLYGLLVRLHRLLAADPDLEELASEAAALREGYDRPLLLAIAGEFNAGKSTLLNALVGEAVAPMGVTPTTAAVNVFLYGARRAARVIARDGSAMEVDFAEVARFIDRRRGAGAASVRHVEIVWPAEPLREVSLVDTPGFNAAEEEHEAVARAFLGRADAVLWIFDAAHAGSASEKSAIEALGPLRGKVVGVLNKADHLGPADREMVITRLRAAFAGEVADWVALSARDALEARRTGDEGALGKSGFSNLWSLLEARFFARARAAKREATTARAKALIASARARAEGARETAVAALAFAAARRLSAMEVERRLVGDLVPALEEAHRAGMLRVVVDTASEALGIAQRRGPAAISALLGPKVSDADLDFLARVAGDRLREHVEDLCERAAREVERSGRGELGAWREAPERARLAAEPLLSLAARAVDEARADLAAGPFARAQAYARGWLEGGGLRAAASSLARAAGAAEWERALAAALPAALPWREPFEAWARGYARALEGVAAEAQRRLENTRAELEARLVVPLRDLERALTDLEGR
jgi:tetratricopeptide (TPR) repeat protein